MFWKTKKVEEKYTTNIFGKNVTFTNFTELAQLLETASALQDQNRRDYNLLFERQNLILDHLKLKYISETETKEPAKLVEETVSLEDLAVRLNNSWGGGKVLLSNYPGNYPGNYPCHFVTESPTKSKKKGRPKKK